MNDILPLATSSATTTFIQTTTGLERILVFEAIIINLFLMLVGVIVILKTLLKNGVFKK